jgi:hypothetical protein
MVILQLKLLLCLAVWKFQRGPLGFEPWLIWVLPVDGVQCCAWHACRVVLKICAAKLLVSNDLKLPLTTEPFPAAAVGRFEGGGAGQFDRPAGIAVSEGEVFVTSYDHRVQVLK